MDLSKRHGMGSGAMSAMPTATSAPSSDGMAMGHSMGMQDMVMTFFTAVDTPLFSTAWQPETPGQYAGTCIFLIVLAVAFRSLLALRCNLREITARYNRRRDTAILQREPSFDEAKKVYSRYPAEPWRVNDALVWATLDTTLAGVSYLMMIAVMTMNVGYYLSILGGTFLGSFALGRWAGPAAH